MPSLEATVWFEALAASEAIHSQRERDPGSPLAIDGNPTAMTARDTS